MVMVRYSTRLELESKAKRLGYEPDRDDTDADLVLAINTRSSGTDGRLLPHDGGNSPSDFGLPAPARER
jgi:hypothetical protein